MPAERCFELRQRLGGDFAKREAGADNRVDEALSRWDARFGRKT
jgi:hypothetical protein